MNIRTSSDSLLIGCRTTRIYCRPDCPAGRHMKTENRMHFVSRDEARREGYRACKICKPDGEDAVPETFYVSRYQSPLGPYLLASSDRGIVCVKTEDQAAASLARWARDGIAVQEHGEDNQRLSGQLDAYFAGRLTRFDLPLDLRGSAFQRRVWRSLCEIPFGETRTYHQIAEAVGRPKASRAVGRANATNPVAIVVPCHRVIGSDGKLTGYGGGLHRKEALLDLEARTVSNSAPQGVAG